MRVIIVFALLELCLTLGACARRSQASYLELPPAPAQSYGSERSPAIVKASARARGKPNPQRLPPPVPEKKRTEWSSSAQADNPSTLSNQEWDSTSVVPGIEVKFATARAKAERVGVENLTEADIDGLRHEQIRQLRGYELLCRESLEQPDIANLGHFERRVLSGQMDLAPVRPRRESLNLPRQDVLKKPSRDCNICDAKIHLDYRSRSFS